MSTAQSKTLTDFIQLQNRYALTHATRAANQLGIFQSLADGQKTAVELATELSLQLEPLERLLAVLDKTELIERYGEYFALSTIAQLIPAPYLDFGDLYWQQLTDYIRSGESPTTEIAEKPIVNGAPSANFPPTSDEAYWNQKATEEWMLTPIAIDATQALDIGKSRRAMRILEIGSGSAVFAATMAHRDPDSIINLLDTTAGLERSQKTVDSIGLENQTVMIPVTDIHDLSSVEELEDQEFDLILLAGIVHRLLPNQCQSLFGQIQPLVRHERELAIIDVFPGQEEGETNRAIFELELELRTTHGQLHDPTDLRSWLDAAGFGHMQYAHLPSPPYYWGLLVAEK